MIARVGRMQKGLTNGCFRCRAAGADESQLRRQLPRTELPDYRQITGSPKAILYQAANLAKTRHPLPARLTSRDGSPAPQTLKGGTGIAPQCFFLKAGTISREVREVTKSPWQSNSRAAPERDYLALLSYLPLNSAWHLPKLVLYSTRIRRQLRTSSGLIGLFPAGAGRRQAVLDSVCVGGRGGSTGVCCRAAACGYHEGAGSIYGRDALRPMEREGL